MPDPGLSITCPQCHKRLRVHGGNRGRKFPCPTPGCGNVLVVPAAPQQLGEVLDLDDDEPAALPRPAARRRPVPRDLDEDEEPDAPTRKSPAMLIGILAAAAIVLAGLGGLGYWIYSSRTSRDTANPPAGTDPGGGGNLASGPRVTLLAKLPDSIKVRDYYVAGEFRRGDRFGGVPGKDWPQTLPTGTERVNVGIAFEFEPPDGTKLDVEIESESGLVKQRSGGLMLTIRGPEGTTVELACEPMSGAFPDGRYKAKVKIDGKPAAELNFAVGERLPGVSASTLKGTKWHQGSGPDSGYHFDFAADGTLVVVASWEKGHKMMGTWAADGETVTGSVEKTDGSGQRMEFRGQCLKDEIRMRSRSGMGDSWYALGLLVKDDGKRHDLDENMKVDPLDVPTPLQKKN